MRGTVRLDVPIDVNKLPMPLVATPLERGLRRALSGLLFVVVIAIVAALLTRAHSDAVVMGSVLAVLALGIAMQLAGKRSRRVLEANHFLICPKCLAPLADVAAERSCPACGFEFGSPGALETLWRGVYGEARPEAASAGEAAEEAGAGEEGRGS